jgi:hypothetical protein
LRKDKAAESLQQLSSGKDVQAETGADGSLISLRYINSSGRQVIIEKSGGSFYTRTLNAQIEKRIFMRTGEINITLFSATDAAGIPDAARTNWLYFQRR